MLLAVDIGNTHVVMGVFRNHQMIAEWRLPSGVGADIIWQKLQQHCKAGHIPVSEISAVGISSVVPRLTQDLETVARNHLQVDPIVINAGLDLGFEINYDDPMSVGADRLCNVAAGYKKYGGPLIIIDFGTATTYSVVSKKGDFLGGAITLGLKSTAETLRSRTAKLPTVDLNFPERVIGESTAECLQSGIMIGTVDAVEGMVSRIRQELGEAARVIATGGLASTISEHIASIEAIEPTLVLDGVRWICERAQDLKRHAKP